MGIKDLNKVVANYPITSKKNWKSIIIDGSNMLVKYIALTYSQLERDSEINSVNKSLKYQIQYIVQSTVNCMVTTFKSLVRKYNETTIYIVIDPIKSPIYVINKDNTVISIDAKTLTRQKRTKAQQRETIDNKIAQIEFQFGKITNEMKSVIKQMNYFNNVPTQNKLMEIIIQSVYEEVKNFKLPVIMIQAISEADFVIKNIASYVDKPALVMSADTDYLILLADIPGVYKSEIKINAPVYYPYLLWQNVYHIYDINILWRIATLFGNDYTIDRIIAATPDNVNGLCNLFSNSEYSVKGTKIKTILKSVTLTEYIQDNLDEVIMNSTLKDLCLTSLSIYSNWLFNGKFILYNPEKTIDESIQYLYNELIKLFGKIYDWSKNEDSDNPINRYINIHEETFEDIEFEFKSTPKRLIIVDDINDGHKKKSNHSELKSINNVEENSSITTIEESKYNEIESVNNTTAKKSIVMFGEYIQSNEEVDKNNYI